MYIALALIAVMCIVAAGYLYKKDREVCPRCGTILTKNNIWYMDDDANICIECYAKEMAPERYEHYYAER